MDKATVVSLSAGYPDPLVGKPRLWAAMACKDGRVRQSGSCLTPNMLRWLMKHLKNGGFPSKDQVVIKGALLTGWFFMLWASELLPEAEGHDPLNGALRLADVVF